MNSKGLEKQTVNTVRHRVMRALKILGYPFTVEELNDVMCRVHLAYQGEDYLIDIDDSDYIRLQLIDGTYAEFDDIEEFFTSKACNKRGQLEILSNDCIYTLGGRAGSTS